MVSTASATAWYGQGTPLPPYIRCRAATLPASASSSMPTAVCRFHLVLPEEERPVSTAADSESETTERPASPTGPAEITLLPPPTTATPRVPPWRHPASPPVISHHRLLHHPISHHSSQLTSSPAISYPLPSHIIADHLGSIAGPLIWPDIRPVMFRLSAVRGPLIRPVMFHLSAVRGPLIWPVMFRLSAVRGPLIRPVMFYLSAVCLSSRCRLTVAAAAA